MHPASLAAPSRALAAELLARFPSLLPACSATRYEGIPGQHLLVQVRSPAGRDRDVTLWLEGGEEPSLAFGDRGWHVHASHVRAGPDETWEEESLLDLLGAILADQFVIVDVGDRGVGATLDLRDPSALLDALTAPRETGRVRLMTFSGTRDREVRIQDLEAEP